MSSHTSKNSEESSKSSTKEDSQQGPAEQCGEPDRQRDDTFVQIIADVEGLLELDTPEHVQELERAASAQPRISSNEEGPDNAPREPAADTLDSKQSTETHDRGIHPAADKQETTIADPYDYATFPWDGMSDFSVSLWGGDYCYDDTNDHLPWAQPLVRDVAPERIIDDSPSRKEWLRQKRERGEKNQYLDQMMSMVGHEEVKAHFLFVKERYEMAKRWGEDLDQLDHHLVLQGKAGTGKAGPGP